jgi:hypothetical protein
MWGVKVVHGIHNHETASYIDGHEFGSRLNELGKNLVHDLGNSTAPREIRSILQQKDPSNTTNVRTIYNAKYSNRVSKRNGLNPTQYALEQLVQKKYLHNWRTNPDTNEITDIIWVHPESLELYVNFPSVLVIDATYKTNEYRIPLLEVVGITSTMQTYSLMFGYLSNEKAERVAWALGTLKQWMVERGALMPSVLVSDRDLALIKALEECFPEAHHILCVWHINQAIMKKCKPILTNCWSEFSSQWNSLIRSSTLLSYERRWDAIYEEYRQYPTVTTYLWETWLMPYKERFVAAWTNQAMHLGSNSSQRYNHFINLPFIKMLNTLCTFSIYTR